MYEDAGNLKFEFDSLISEYEKSYLDVRTDIAEFIGSSILELEGNKEVRRILTDFYQKNLLDVVVEILCSKRYLEALFNKKSATFLYEVAKKSEFKRVDLQTKYLEKRDLISSVIGLYNTYILELNIEFQILVRNMKESDYDKLLKILKVTNKLKYIQPFLDKHVYELSPFKFETLLQFTESILGCKDRLNESGIIEAIERKIEELYN